MEGSGSRTVKMALAPAMNAIACSVSEYSMRPAAKRMMELRPIIGKEESYMPSVAGTNRTEWTGRESRTWAGRYERSRSCGGAPGS